MPFLKVGPRKAVFTPPRKSSGPVAFGAPYSLGAGQNSGNAVQRTVGVAVPVGDVAVVFSATRAAETILSITDTKNNSWSQSPHYPGLWFAQISAGKALTAADSITVTYTGASTGTARKTLAAMAFTPPEGWVLDHFEPLNDSSAPTTVKTLPIAASAAGAQSYLIVVASFIELFNAQVYTLDPDYTNVTLFTQNSDYSVRLDYRVVASAAGDTYNSSHTTSATDHKITALVFRGAPA